jgi:hypothetical protein
VTSIRARQAVICEIFETGSHDRHDSSEIQGFSQDDLNFRDTD